MGSNPTLSATNYLNSSIGTHGKGNGEGWRAYLHVAGQRETKLFRTQREARGWAAAREEELRAGRANLTLADAAERWLKQKLPSLDYEGSLIQIASAAWRAPGIRFNTPLIILKSSGRIRLLFTYRSRPTLDQ